MSATAPPPLAPDLTEGLRRLKMAAMRRIAPELLVTAKTQRWSPEEFLRTLVQAEITATSANTKKQKDDSASEEAKAARQKRVRIALGAFLVRNSNVHENFEVHDGDFRHRGAARFRPAHP